MDDPNKLIDAAGKALGDASVESNKVAQGVGGWLMSHKWVIFAVMAAAGVAFIAGMIHKGLL